MTEIQGEIELLKRITAGDEDAMSQLYLAYESPIYAFAQKKLNDSQAAADIVHEVMIAVWKNAAGFQGKSKLKSWLMGIAHNKIVDYLRKVKRYETDEIDDELPDEQTEATVEVIQAAQNRSFLEYCLEKLSEVHREVVHLAFFEDLTYGDISDIVGKPEGTVKTRMFHAKQLLKKCLQGRLGTER